MTTQMNTSKLLGDLARFTSWCIRNGPFEGCDLDGASVQEQAVKCGLLIPTKFDPAIHGEPPEHIEAGDPWFVFSDDFKALCAVTPLSR
jgi:hypothetical protein